MPKLTDTKVAGYYLYFTAKCNINGEPVHVHASESKRLIEAGSAKIWVYIDGKTEIAERGYLSSRDLLTICKYIEHHYLEIFFLWEKVFSKLEIYGKPGLLYTALEIQQQEQQQECVHLESGSEQFKKLNLFGDFVD